MIVGGPIQSIEIIQLTSHPDLLSENQLYHSTDIEDRLPAQLVRFDGVAVRFPHLKRRALQIGYKLLYYRFINGVQGPRTESEKDVFGDSIKKLLVNYS